MDILKRPKKPDLSDPKQKSVRLSLTLQPYQKEYINYLAQKRGFRSMNEFVLSLVIKEIEKEENENII